MRDSTGVVEPVLLKLKGFGLGRTAHAMEAARNNCSGQSRMQRAPAKVEFTQGNRSMTGCYLVDFSCMVDRLTADRAAPATVLSRRAGSAPADLPLGSAGAALSPAAVFFLAAWPRMRAPVAQCRLLTPLPGSVLTARQRVRPHRLFQLAAPDSP